jgi:hypothetical protein
MAPVVTVEVVVLVDDVLDDLDVLVVVIRSA